MLLYEHVMCLCGPAVTVSHIPNLTESSSVSLLSGEYFGFMQYRAEKLC